MQYHHDYIYLLTNLYQQAANARARAEVEGNPAVASRYLREAAVYLRLLYYAVPQEVSRYVSRRLKRLEKKAEKKAERDDNEGEGGEEQEGQTLSISDYFDRIQEECNKIMLKDERLWVKQDECNGETAAALDVLFALISEGLNLAGVFRYVSEERRVKARA